MILDVLNILNAEQIRCNIFDIYYVIRRNIFDIY